MSSGPETIGKKIPRKQITYIGKKKSPSGPSNKAVDQNTTTQSFSFINEIETLIKVLFYICVFPVSDYLKLQKHRR